MKHRFESVRDLQQSPRSLVTTRGQDHYLTLYPLRYRWKTTQCTTTAIQTNGIDNRPISSQISPTVKRK